MRLLRAEFTKLLRPLTLWIAVAGVAVSVLFAWQGVKNASANSANRPGAAPPPLSCHDFGLAPGPLCEQAIAVQQQITALREQQAKGKPESRHSRQQSDALPVEHPLGAGKLPAGFMASLPGALLILLLAGGHVGNEWNGKTIKCLLCQEGRRWRILAAKVVTLWSAGLALLAVDWAVLAALSPLWKATYPLSDPGLSWSGAWTAMAADVARAPLVIAVFAVLGVVAAVIVRNGLGAFVLGAAALVASLMAAGFSAASPWTLTWWVSGWMRFHSRGFVVYHFWLDAFPSGGHPAYVTGILGLVGAIVVMATAAFAVFQRADITA